MMLINFLKTKFIEWRKKRRVREIVNYGDNCMIHNAEIFFYRGKYYYINYENNTVQEVPRPW